MKNENLIISSKKAVNVLCLALKKDKEYFYSWQSCIAMAYKDAEYQYKSKAKKKYLNTNDKHKIANLAATAFLNQLCK